MKHYLLLGWLLLPLPVIVYHFGPGQEWLLRDQAQSLIRQALAAENEKNWLGAEALYRDAENKIGGKEPAVLAQLQVATARTRYRQGDVVSALETMERLTMDPKFETLPVEVRQGARELSGRMHYYAAWVMRLEGARRDLWMEEAELSRQNYRLLAEESAAAKGGEDASPHVSNLEAAVRLERMGLIELMAKPLPEEGQCMKCTGLTEKMDKKKCSRCKGKKPGIGEQQQEGPPKNGAGIQRYQPGGGS